MLENKVIIYDDSCPMCKVYTQGFVQMRILTADHRVGFARADAVYTAQLDLNRARHEIPLLDTQTGEVLYGMDALFCLIGHRFPIFTPLFRMPRFRTLIYSFYQIVTYNRRVIAGCAPPREGFNCAPDFNKAVRLRYLRLAVVGWLLLICGMMGMAWFANQRLLAGMLAVCLGIQGIRFSQSSRTRCFWDKMGGVATNHLLFGLLLVPSLLPLPEPARWTNFGIAATVAFLDARRRKRNCGNCLCNQKRRITKQEKK